MNLGSFTGRSLDVERSPELECALGNGQQTHPAGRHAFGGESLSVIHDLKGNRSIRECQPDEDGFRIRVLHHIVQRFLRDTVKSVLAFKVDIGLHA